VIRCVTGEVAAVGQELASVTRSAPKDANCVRINASKSGAKRVAKRAAKRAAKRIKVIKMIGVIGAVRAVRAIRAVEVISDKNMARQ